MNESWFPLPEVAKKRAIIAEIIRKLTEEQRMGEVVSWPKISFLPSETDVLRGSQLWETLEEEVPKAATIKIDKSKEDDRGCAAEFQVKAFCSPTAEEGGLPLGVGIP